MITSLSLRSKLRIALRLPHGITQNGFIQNVIIRNFPVNYRIALKKQAHLDLKIIALMRVRNEELLISDSLNHVSSFADGILVLDDASADKTVQIVLNHPKVIGVIENKKWRSRNRIWEETAHRRKLLQIASKYRPDWFFYCDADERFEGDLRDFLLMKCPPEITAVRVNLLDAYITAEDQDDFKPHNKLMNFRKYFGTERREILMAWRSSALAEYYKPDSREPSITFGDTTTNFWCQHYGKAISIQDWETTCDYYINNFPEIYQTRWLARKGKAIHTRSDFNTDLKTWEDAKASSELLE